ncbi:MAG: TIM barrel protein [Planctomycetaceae bacterium]
MRPLSDNHRVTRRDVLKVSAAGCGAVIGASAALAEPSDESKSASEKDFALNYMLASCMYGYMYVGEIFPEVAKCGATHLDLWPKKHGNQREQLTDLGEARFAELLKKHSIKLGCITQYALGPFGLTEEFQLARRFECELIVTGGDGPKGLAGAELKAAVGEFVERMKPHLAVAEENSVTVAIENHANNLFESADSLRYLRDLSPSKHLKVGLAPYHLAQDAEQLATLIRDLGDSIAMFYAWQHGNGCMTRLPKEDELLQLPGRGPLDFAPLMKALRDIQYQGWTEIFMHPVPRGIPILETAEEVTHEINRSREYLQERLRTIGRV